MTIIAHQVKSLGTLFCLLILLFFNLKFNLEAVEGQSKASLTENAILRSVRGLRTGALSGTLYKYCFYLGKKDLFSDITCSTATVNPNNTTHVGNYTYENNETAGPAIFLILFCLSFLQSKSSLLKNKNTPKLMFRGIRHLSAVSLEARLRPLEGTVSEVK